MNITKDIHLSHVKFTMDDEAYKILKSYLDKLTIAFSSNSSKNEILEDIESHIAELFSTNNSINREISVSEVNNAIEVLGTPEELAEDENEQDSPSKNTNTNKKLFRDTDNSYVGGVASGLAHYFGISPAWIRVLFILFFFLPVPFTTLAYIILWIVVPSAKSIADKIRMTGEAVSVASIKNKIESVLPEIEKEILDFDKKHAKGLWKKVKYYLKKTINFLLATSTKLLKIISIIFGLMRVSNNSVIQGVATVYIEFFRGTSLMVQLFWFYYVLPFFGVSLEAFTSGVVAIGLNFGAYGAEIVRGGILAVPKSQWEGAHALNFSPAKRMRRIIIPQIFPIILPPAANLTVELLKATALVALVTVVDLTFEAKQINSITWLSAQCFGTALLIYYIISRFFLVPFLRWLEVLAARKVGRGKI